MRHNSKLLRMAVFMALLVAVTGCGGIHASKSISPLDFFLPGLLQSDPVPAQPDPTLPTQDPVEQLAKN